MPIFYDLIYLAIGIIYLPVFLWRKKLHRHFSQRLGLLPAGLKVQASVWIHAVSVGEVISIRGLLEELKKAYPEKNFVISTVTPTGNRIARNITANRDLVIYLPLDLSFIVERVVSIIKPSLFILVETELWPNLIRSLYLRGVPIAIVNARISDASFKRYLCVRFLLKGMLGKISLFCAQTTRDAERLRRLGAPKNRIRITGNMKFDISGAAALKKAPEDLRLKLGINPKEKLFVAGSTHPQEEEAVLAAYEKLSGIFKDLRLLIAPRHPERALRVESLIRLKGFDAIRVSKLAEKPAAGIDKKPVFILDTVGELLYFYNIADIVFVGGSLIKKGGHNILEPAILGKPILFGPHMFNFRDIAALFLEQDAAVMVKDQEQLYLKVKDLLDNPSKAELLSQKAGGLLTANQGATAKNLEAIKDLCRNTSTI